MNKENNTSSNTSNVMIVITLPMDIHSTLKKVCEETGSDIGDFLRSSIQKNLKDIENDSNNRDVNKRPNTTNQGGG